MGKRERRKKDKESEKRGNEKEGKRNTRRE